MTTTGQQKKPIHLYRYHAFMLLYHGFMLLRRLTLVMLLVLGLLAGFMEVRLLVRYIGSYGWSTTQGRVLKVDWGSSGKSFLQATYTYTVEGKTHLGHQLNVEGEFRMFASLGEKHDELLTRQQQGLPTKVFYNPRHPEDSFLFFGFPMNPVSHFICLYFLFQALGAGMNFQALWRGEGWRSPTP